MNDDELLATLRAALERAERQKQEADARIAEVKQEADARIAEVKQEADARIAEIRGGEVGAVTAASRTSVEAAAQVKRYRTMIDVAEGVTTRHNYTKVAGDVDLAELARVAREAIAAGQYVGQAVASHFDINVGNAHNYITKARAAGHDIPRRKKLRAEPSRPAHQEPNGPRRIEPVAAPAPAASPARSERDLPAGHFECDDCDEHFASIPQLTRHVITAHDRRHLSAAERTPVAA